MSIWTVIAAIVVVIAAILYIVEETMRWMKRFSDYRTRQLLKQHAALHDGATKAIEGTFDLWWQSGPELAVRAKARAQSMSVTNTLMENVAATILEEVITDRIRGIAMHVAMHAYMHASERKFVARVPAKVRDPLEKFLTEHQDELNEQRMQLLDHGVDLEALDEHFARTQ